MGDLSQLKEIIAINKVDELIFSAKDLDSQEIIKEMLQLTDISVDFKIAPPESLSIIGSNSINTAGDLYSLNFNHIGKNINRRKKRVLDIMVSIVLILISPLMLFLVKKPLGYLKNSFKVLSGRNSWVGFSTVMQKNKSITPSIKSGILNPSMNMKHFGEDENFEIKLNLMYAKDFSIQSDLLIIIRNWHALGD